MFALYRLGYSFAIIAEYLTQFELLWLGPPFHTPFIFNNKKDRCFSYYCSRWKTRSSSGGLTRTYYYEVDISLCLIYFCNHKISNKLSTKQNK